MGHVLGRPRRDPQLELMKLPLFRVGLVVPHVEDQRGLAQEDGVRRERGNELRDRRIVGVVVGSQLAVLGDVEIVLGVVILELEGERLRELDARADARRRMSPPPLEVLDLSGG